jgi:cyclic pyranopterin phosphate synthase
VELVDSYARVVRDLRISVTDRCNFRCVYCMPAEGLQWVPRDEVLTFEEIERLARLFIERLGVESLRLTGGEPTVRAHLPELVERLAAIRRPDGSAPDLSLTTNGATLRLLAGDLRAAGLERVNISCDSLRRERFAEMTRRDRLGAVLDGIAAAKEAGFDPVKVNAVVMRGVNDDELVEFAAFGRERGVQPRFIEFMPLDADGAWSMDKVVPAREIVATIDAVFPLEPVEHGPEPAARWRYLDGAGEIGVIASVTSPFCGSCDRVRITAEGQFRTCLFATSESDLRGPLRAGASDEELASIVAGAVSGKWAGHRIGRVDFVRPQRSMSQIGG